MKGAEKALLCATRDRLRGCGFADDACNVEFDEMAPSTTGDVYIAVTPNGWRRGNHHGTSGGVNNLVYSIQVTIVKRVRAVPRDRLRDAFMYHLDSLDDLVDQVYIPIDFDYDLMNAANSLLKENTGSDQGFYHPLVFQSVESKPRKISGDIFAATSESNVALARTVTFGDATRDTYK